MARITSHTTIKVTVLSPSKTMYQSDSLPQPCWANYIALRWEPAHPQTMPLLTSSTFIHFYCKGKLDMFWSDQHCWNWKLLGTKKHKFGSRRWFMLKLSQFNPGLHKTVSDRLLRPTWYLITTDISEILTKKLIFKLIATSGGHSSVT